ncbi:MAG: tryptophan--tRNA ligase [bacterium]
MDKNRVLSGARPTGALHLGHYWGTLLNWVELQKDYQCFYFVADWHALTTEFERPEIIRPSIAEMVMDWLAVGLDPDESVLFIQSSVKEHAELYLLLGMMASVARLERVPSYKQFQEETGRDLSTYGFLGYPVLMSADILMYRSHAVPVGEDQLAHVELAREFARRFNGLYNEVFPEPEALLTEASRVPGTDGRKMSKSYGNAIYLAEDPDSIARKIKTMMTDPARQRRTDAGDPEVCPVYDLHRLYSEHETLMWAADGCRSAGIGCIECKNALTPRIVDSLSPVREKRSYYQKHPDKITAVLEAGNKKARDFAEKTMDMVRQAMKMA